MGIDINLITYKTKEYKEQKTTNIRAYPTVAK